MKSFVCSLCHNGILGGGLYLNSQSLTYKTNKLTVDQKYRNLVLPLKEIKEISWKWIIFPVATVDMKNGERYKFIIFNNHALKNGFKNILTKYKAANSNLSSRTALNVGAFLVQIRSNTLCDDTHDINSCS